jgi:tetratricopeptide (TPR) repeat protein
MGVASLAESRLARAMRRRGRLEEARRSAERAVSLDRLSLSQSPASQDSALRLSASLRLLARMEEARRDYPAAIARLRESNQVLEALRARAAEMAAIDRAVMVGRSLLGSLLGEAGETAEALALLRDAYETAGRRAASDPVDARAMRDLQAISLRYAGALLDARLRHDGEPVLRRALDISRQLLQGDPDEREARLNHGIALVWQAEYLSDAGDVAGALRAREQALALHEELLRSAPGDPDLLLPYLLNAAEIARRGDGGLCARALSGRRHGAFDETPELAAAEAALRTACSR